MFELAADGDLRPILLPRQCNQYAVADSRESAQVICGLESLIAAKAKKPLVSLLAALAIPFKQKAAVTSAALASLPGLPPQPRVRLP